MNFTRALFAPILALAFGITGCAGTTTVIDAPYTLEASQSGGFAGISEEIVIDSAAKTIAARENEQAMPRVATLTDAEIATITAAIEAADLKHPGEPHTCDGCTDSIGSNYVLKTGGQTFDTGWEDGSLPDERIALGEAVWKLRDEKVPPPEGSQ
ncbi:MAG: hypothetical protein QM820_09390 [Minicystis sp.]